MVEFKDVSKVYDNRIFAISDINFTIEPGEFVFLIGPSGSGKTTIIKMLIRDEVPSTGKIIFNERDITKISRDSVYKLRREIGVIFQDYKLVQEKTAYENVAFAMEAAGKKNSEIKETVPYVLDIVGLSGRMNAFPRQLSGGEQQRVTIARAIANNPKILIADEPTGNLDPASAWDIVQILSKINNWGTTVIMSTHGTDIVNALNKRVIQMADGRIIRDDKDGSYDEANLDYEVKLLEKTDKKKEEQTDHPKTTFKVKFNSKDEVPEEKQEVQEEVKPENPNKILGIFSRLKRAPVTSKEDEADQVIEEEVQKELDIQEIKEEEERIEESKKEAIKTAHEGKDSQDNTSEELPSKLFVDMLKKEDSIASTIDEQKQEDEDDKVHVAGKLKITNKKAKEWVENSKKTPVSKLDLPKEVIKDLKTAGYKYVEEVIEDGPEGLTDNLMIDPEEVVLISKEIKRFLEDNHKE